MEYTQEEHDIEESENEDEVEQVLPGKLPFTPIAIDSFVPRNGVSLFFLSHAHSGMQTTSNIVLKFQDHCTGLVKGWKHGKIYCTELTKRIVVHTYQLDEDLLVFHYL